MKILKLMLLSVLLTVVITIILIYQNNDLMKMHHWLELMGIEAILQIMFNIVNGKKI